MIEGTISDALEMRALLRESLLADAPRVRHTLRTFASSWLTTRLGSLKKSTATKYANDLELHILPALGDYFIDTLRPQDVRDFINTQSAKYSAWSVINRLRLIRVIAKDALAEDATAIDFAARVKGPTPKSYTQDEPNLLTADELGRLLVEIPLQWHALVLVMATTGLRWGEVSALKWTDIDHESGLIRVRRSNWKGSEQVPKTSKSLRDVPLLPEVGIALREHRRQLIASQRVNVAGWVFPTREGRLYKGTPLTKVMKRALAKAKIETHVTPHGLRRTFNNLARQVTPRQVVKAITGHTTDSMFEHYSIVSSAEKQQASAGVLRLVREHECGD